MRKMAVSMMAEIADSLYSNAFDFHVGLSSDSSPENSEEETEEPLNLNKNPMDLSLPGPSGISQPNVSVVKGVVQPPQISLLAQIPRPSSPVDVSFIFEDAASNDDDDDDDMNQISSLPVHLSLINLQSPQTSQSRKTPPPKPPRLNRGLLRNKNDINSPDPSPPPRRIIKRSSGEHTHNRKRVKFLPSSSSSSPSPSCSPLPSPPSRRTRSSHRSPSHSPLRSPLSSPPSHRTRSSPRSPSHSPPSHRTRSSGRLPSCSPLPSLPSRRNRSSPRSPLRSPLSSPPSRRTRSSHRSPSPPYNERGVKLPSTTWTDIGTSPPSSDNSTTNTTTTTTTGTTGTIVPSTTATGNSRPFINQRRIATKFTCGNVKNLVDGYNKFCGDGNKWKKIHSYYKFPQRITGTMMKDKWANLIKYNVIHNVDGRWELIADID